MQLKDVLDRVESRLKALNMSAHAASMAAKKPDAVRNLRRAVQNGERRGITTDTLSALAPVLQTTASWLMEGATEVTASSTSLRVVGRIGAGAEILPEFEQLPPEGLYEIDVALSLSPDTIAFVVEGDSMWPRYNAGDVVVCSDAEHDPSLITGREAAVRTADGKRFLKTIRRGSSQNSYDLESHNAAADPRRGNRLGLADPDDAAQPEAGRRSQLAPVNKPCIRLLYLYADGLSRRSS